MIANIKIEADSKYPKEIVESLKIDNVNLPEGMKILMNYDEKRIYIEISMEINSAKALLTLRNTADEILEQINLLEKLLENHSR